MQLVHPDRPAWQSEADYAERAAEIEAENVLRLAADSLIVDSLIAAARAMEDWRRWPGLYRLYRLIEAYRYADAVASEPPTHYDSWRYRRTLTKLWDGWWWEVVSLAQERGETL